MIILCGVEQISLLAYKTEKKKKKKIIIWLVSVRKLCWFIAEKHSIASTLCAIRFFYFGKFNFNYNLW